MVCMFKEKFPKILDLLFFPFEQWMPLKPERGTWKYLWLVKARQCLTLSDRKARQSLKWPSPHKHPRITLWPSTSMGTLYQVSWTLQLSGMVKALGNSKGSNLKFFFEYWSWGIVLFLRTSWERQSHSLWENLFNHLSSGYFENFQQNILGQRNVFHSFMKLAS